MNTRDDEGVDFSHAMDKKPSTLTQTQPIQTEPVKKHKKLIIMGLVLLVLAIIQIVIWYSIRPPKTPEKPNNTPTNNVQNVNSAKK